MTLSRRKTLALIGGGVIVAATGALAYDVTRLPRTAAAPWAAAGQYSDPRMRALSWAILAPNPHNRQPWLVGLSQRDTAILFVDPDRLLPHTDPFNRQITIGLGCFLEILRLAALEQGLGVSFDLFPEGESAAGLDTRPVAICRFAPTAAAPDPLFAQVPHRRSNKEPYDTTREVPTEALVRIAAAAPHFGMGFTNDPADVAALRDLSLQAIRVEFATEHTLRESVELFRIGRREVDANPDGIDFTGPMFETLRRAGLFTREAAMDLDGIVAQSADAAFAANMQSAMAHLWQVTPSNTRTDQIRAGQDWVRINLAATALGLGLQPLSQALQEFPEMAALYGEIHGRLAPEGGTVQMWARVGYGPQVPPARAGPWRTRLSDNASDIRTFFSLFNEIAIIEQLSRARFEARLPKGVLVSHFAVLNHLIRVGDGRTPLEMAQAFQVPKTTLSHTLALVEGRGWIEMRPNPEDGRSKRVWITEAGRAFQAEAIGLLAPDVAEIAAAFPAGEVAALLPKLTALRVYLDRTRDG